MSSSHLGNELGSSRTGGRALADCQRANPSLRCIRNVTLVSNVCECKKRKLACFNFNALILETGTDRHNLTLVFSFTMNQNLTRRHAEQAHVKTSHVIYVYHAI